MLTIYLSKNTYRVHVETRCTTYLQLIPYGTILNEMSATNMVRSPEDLTVKNSDQGISLWVGNTGDNASQ